MSNIITASPEQFISVQNSELKTNSIKIAEAFNKRHSDVLRSIDKILMQVSDNFNKRNFALIQIDVELGSNRVRKDKAFEMTKDGFMLLVMSFTGQKAMTIKEAYINAFNLMQSKIFPPRQLISSDRQNDINRVVDAISSSQPWVEKDAVIASIKREFDISSVSNLPDDKYGELCCFLGIKSDDDRMINLVKTKIREAGKKGISAVLLTRKTRQLDVKARKLILNRLESRGYISSSKNRIGKSKKKTTFFFWCN